MTENPFARSAAMLGEDAMTRLQSARVAVFGVGGVGGYVCEALVRSGIGTLDVFDKDDVSVTNLNRQIIALRSTVGQDKVSVLAARMRDINPDVVINEHKVFYLPDNADDFDLSQYDYVVDAVDTVAAKIELAVRCEQLNVPLIAAMGAGNKLDPTAFEVANISKTSVCPLARVMRIECRKRGIKKLKVVYSKEQARKPLGKPSESSGVRKDIPASNAFVPSVAGLIIAGEVIKDLCDVK